VDRALWDRGVVQWVGHYGIDGIVDSSVTRALWDSEVAQWIE